jgi:hypothetical protein
MKDEEKVQVCSLYHEGRVGKVRDAEKNQIYSLYMKGGHSK